MAFKKLWKVLVCISALGAAIGAALIVFRKMDKSYEDFDDEDFDFDFAFEDEEEERSYTTLSSDTAEASEGPAGGEEASPSEAEQAAANEEIHS